jgi:hypothetical protein
MTKKTFAELLDSVREGGAILRGEQRPWRSFRFEETQSKLIEQLARRERRDRTLA